MHITAIEDVLGIKRTSFATLRLSRPAMLATDDRFRLISILLICLPGAYALNIYQLSRACRLEDGFHMCSENNKCVQRHILFEAHCKTDRINCTDDEFRCRIINRCVPRKLLNTEEGCMLDNKERILLPCRSDEFTCRISHLCIPRWAVRNDEYDCETKEIFDKSDEEDALAECTPHEFTCERSRRCIPREWVMDGAGDCPNYYEDENSPLPACLEEDEFRCTTSGRCVQRYRVNDGFNDCNDGSDEIEPLPFCYNRTEFRCEDTGRCIMRSWMFDGTENCKDGSDEEYTNEYSCQSGEFACHNGRRCIPLKYLCDGMDQCGDCSDEVEACDEPRMWRCTDDPLRTCIPQSYGCDAFGDCPNGMDNPSYLPGLKCKAVTIGINTENCVIPQWTLFDENAVCQDRSDVCFENGVFQCSYCADNKTIIAKRQICDGLVDCRDITDECLCNMERRNGQTKALCDSVCYAHNASIPCQYCAPGEIYCAEAGNCFTQSAICDGNSDCPSGIDEIYCSEGTSEDASLPKEHNDTFVCWPIPEEMLAAIKRFNLFSLFVNMVPKYATRCDGVIECARFEDECSASCTHVPDACQTFELVTFAIIEEIIGATVPVAVRACKDYNLVDSLFDYLGYVIGYSICNGVSECTGGEDEENCTKRFECDAGTTVWPTGVKRVVSIDEDQKCDLNIDCANATDERDCNTTTHLYCAGGSPLFVPREVELDGKQDCDDDTDECPPSAYEDNPFSSREEMISNVVLGYFIWLMVALAIIGNFAVMVETCFSEMHKNSPQSTAVSKCNRLLIMNLAMSDLFMGIALLIIASKSLSFNGRYCKYEKAWRVSGLCNTIGVLTVLSSETSVFTLVILTYYRLYGVYRPFACRNMKVRNALIATIVAWLCSGILALFPLLPIINHSTVTHALISPSAYFQSTVVSWPDMHSYAVRLFSLGNRTNALTYGLSNWESVHNAFNTVYPEFEPTIFGYFGYYSAHAVCLPRLFRIKGTPSLHAMSLFVISLNFCSLLFILIAYILIYRKSAPGSAVVGNVTSQRENRNRAMQRKITILIATDVCCWLPICLMTFLSQVAAPVSGITYAIAAIVLLPINSSLNPIIYSNGFEVSRQAIARAFASMNRHARRTITRRSAGSNHVVGRPIPMRGIHISGGHKQGQATTPGISNPNTEP